MRKSKVSEKIITQHKISAEGTLNTDNLNEGAIIIETEDGEFNLDRFLDKFNGKYVKITINETSEEIPEI